MVNRIAFCVFLSACTVAPLPLKMPAPAPAPAPIIQTRTRIVVKVERIPNQTSAADFKSLPQPVLTAPATSKSIGIYLGKTTDALEQCRGDLQALGGFTVGNSAP